MTQCIVRKFAKIYGEITAVQLDKALELVDNGRIKSGLELAFFECVLAGNNVDDILENYKAPRKAPTFSEETQTKRYEKQLAKLKAKYGING